MISVTTEKFRKALSKLPIDIQEKANCAYKIWLDDPFHPSLHFKRVHPNEQIYSVRVGLYHRALGVKEHDSMIWFWIGSHEEYNSIISTL
jgi:mRNA-degrading endonuclease RelE of RelBE toxin-antitoxin system